MKKLLAMILTVALLLSSVCLFTLGTAAEGGYTVTMTQLVGFEADVTTTTNAPVVATGVTAACDAAIGSTFSFLVNVVPDDNTLAVKDYTLVADGKLVGKGISANYNAGNNSCTVFITLPEGTYHEVVATGYDTNGDAYEVVRFVDLTLTAPENEASEEGIPVEYTPVWSLLSSDLTGISGANNLTVTECEDGYATFQASKGDPYGSYISGAETKIGRFLLIKYRNNTIIPRMQIYMAQAAGISSDSNMIEFEIAANMSGWTYAVVDLSKNAFYNKDTQAVYHFRFDPLEARNVNGGQYTFTGEESVDVAYIMGFTTRAGMQGWLEAHELHTVTKTATLIESQLTSIDGKLSYIDKLGDVYEVTDNGDGTYSYTFEATDVRTPVNTTPTLLINGSGLAGVTFNNVESAMDATTGVVTLTATGSDPYYTIFDSARTADRYMAVCYRTSVPDKMEFFTSSDGPGPEGGKSFQYPLVSDGTWHIAVIDLSAYSFIDSETYSLNFLRMDILDKSSEGTIEVEYIAFFNNEDAAYQYQHRYITYTVTFMADNKVVEKIVFEPGTTYIREPAVPAKEGYEGVWAEYEMADKNFTVKAIYTPIEVPTDPVTETEKPEEPTEPATEPATKPAAETEKPEEPTAGETTAESVSGNGTEAETGKSSGSGCSSVLGGSALLLVVAAAAVALKKKHG